MGFRVVSAVTFIEHARSLATTARTPRLKGDHHHGSDSEFPLVGYCFDNAYVAHHVFTAADIESHVIAGTTERVADDLIAAGISPRNCESVSDLAGHVHYINWCALYTRYLPTTPRYCFVTVTAITGATGVAYRLGSIPSTLLRGTPIPSSRDCSSSNTSKCGGSGLSLCASTVA